MSADQSAQQVQQEQPKISLPANKLEEAKILFKNALQYKVINTITFFNPEGELNLFRAISTGNFETVLTVVLEIQRGKYKLNMESSKGTYTAVHAAVNVNSPQILELLLQTFSNEFKRCLQLDHERKYFFSLPYLCLLNKSIKCWDVLMKAGYDPSPVSQFNYDKLRLSTVDFHSFIPLVSTISPEQIDVFEKHGFILDAPIFGENNLLALSILPYTPNIDLIKYLLNKGCKLYLRIVTFEIAYKKLKIVPRFKILKEQCKYNPELLPLFNISPQQIMQEPPAPAPVDKQEKK